MANQMDKRIETDGHTIHQEDTLTGTQARQGNSGRSVLIILFVALILIMLAYLPIWMSSSETIKEVEPQLPGQEMQSQTPAPATAPDAQTNDVPTVTPNTAAPAENVNPAPQPATPAPAPAAP